MQRLIVVLSLLILTCMSCSSSKSAGETPAPTVEVPTPTQPVGQIETPSPVASPNPASDTPGSVKLLQGPDINYKGILFNLDPAIGSHLYAFDEAISVDGLTAHYTHFSQTPEEHCQTWCMDVYPVAEFEQAFGFFVFPPAGYRGGSAVIFKAQEMPLSFQNGSGDRGLETSGQSHYSVSNESLKYVFRGYSADKQYGVYVEVPIHAASLPDAAPTITTNVDEILEYNRKAAQSMDALTPADFTPHLDLLDALVASIYVKAP
jgi:hypothetical protein